MSRQKLNEMLQPLVEDLGYEFVGLEYNAHPRNAVLRIYIDAGGGVGLEDCETVSREVAALLDVEDPIPSRYTLEVSSPGLDRPLFTREHFQRFAGEDVSVSLYAPQDGRRRIKGRMLGLEGELLRIESDGEEIAVDFSNIAKARLVPDFGSSLTAGNGER